MDELRDTLDNMTRWITLVGIVLVWAFGLPAKSSDVGMSVERSSPGAAAACQIGAPRPALMELRPTPTAICNYDIGEVQARMMRLFGGGASTLSVESVERLFGIPPMTTSYDDPRTSDYTTIISGAGGWTLMVSVRESFVPINNGPAKFIPGLRPRRLDLFENSLALVDLALKTPPAESRCPPEPFVSGAAAAGWADVTWRVVVTDGGRANPTFIAPDGARSVMILPSGFVQPCLTQLMFSKSPAGRQPQFGLLAIPERPRAPQGHPDK